MYKGCIFFIYLDIQFIPPSLWMGSDTHSTLLKERNTFKIRNHQRKLNMMYAYWPQDATDKRDNLDSLIRINIASFRYSGRKNNSGMWL